MWCPPASSPVLFQVQLVAKKQKGWMFIFCTLSRIVMVITPQATNHHTRLQREAQELLIEGCGGFKGGLICNFIAVSEPVVRFDAGTSPRRLGFY